MKFFKMQGLGNNIIFINEEDLPTYNAELIKFLCDYKMGIGADQLIIYNENNLLKNNQLSIKIFNNDGSSAKACGNAFRALGKYFLNKYNLTKMDIVIEKLIVHTSLLNKDIIQVILPKPKLKWHEIPLSRPLNLENFNITEMMPLSKKVQNIIAKFYCIYAVNVGNPHLVLFKHSKVLESEVAILGKTLEKHHLFPERINVNFAEILPNNNENTIYLKTWERGAGRTLACGTGACATFVAAYEKKLIPTKTATILMEHGNLNVYFNENNNIVMQGEATFLFDGTFNEDIKEKLIRF